MHYKDKFVGIHIGGFCDGYFGRDDYDLKLILASGQNWIVAEGDAGRPAFASFDDPDQMETLILKWSDEFQKIMHEGSHDE